MFAGLPGTGIAGLLYFGLAVGMPFRWLWRLARGRARPGEGRAVAGLGALVAAVVAALWIEAIALNALFESARASGGAIARSIPRAEVTSAYVVPLALGGVASLAFVVALVQVLRWLVPRAIAGPAKATGSGDERGSSPDDRVA